MQLGTALKDHKCARCYELLSIPAVYRDHQWYHQRCFNDGAQQLVNVTRLATAFQFQSHLPLIHNIQGDIL
jgi:hypothetical protein